MKKFFIISVVAMVLTACSQDTTNDYSTPEMRVGFDDETRVQLNEECKTVWNRGDMVSVFNKTDANSCWRYRGADLARSGAIALVSSPSTYTVTFADVYGVYPYNANYSINMFGEISLSIPAEQNWKEGSYGVGDNIMVAIGEDENLSFKNIFGWLKLQFTGSDAISKITFRGNNNEPLTGAITYDPYYMEAVFSEGAGKEITLICPEVALDADKVQTFYIAIAPQTFTKGITVEITTSTGEKITKTTDKKLVIVRNAIQPMVAFEFANTTPANNEIWYTNGSTTKKTSPYKNGAFGANIVSNLYDAEKKCWVLTFDGEVTSIGNQAFSYCRSLKSVTIPDSVTQIGYQVFSDCTSLTCVTIPNSVIEIVHSAFYYCTSLTSVTIGDSVTSIESRAFSCCSSLTSVNIPDSITEIGWAAFSDCTSLKSVTIPDSVTEIEDNAFDGCTSLTSVTIPDSVTEIGYQAFRDCTSLKEVYCKPTTPPSGDSSMFSTNASGRKIYVPRTSVDAYKAASYWSDYRSYIEPYDFE